MPVLLRRLRIALGQVADAVERRCGAAFAVVVVLYVEALFARVAIWRSYDGLDVHPFNFNPNAVSVWAYLGCGDHDVTYAVGAAVVVALVERFVGRAVALVTGGVVAVVSAIVLGTHIALIFTMHTGFSWVALMELWSSPAVGQISTGIHLRDIVLLALALSSFLALAKAPLRARRGVFVASVVVAVAVSVMGLTLEARSVKKTLKTNGCVFLLSEIAHNIRGEDKYARPTSFSEAQKKTMAFVDPVFDAGAGTATTPAPLTRTDAPAPKNVVVVVLESTGFEYLQERRPDGRPLMPALAARAAQGAWFEDHRSAANSSASALFSIFTGLHPVPHTVVYAIRDEAKVPAFPSLWSPNVESFLVTPGELESFFPRPLLRHAGLQEMWGYYNLPAESWGVQYSPANRDERTVFAFFLDRLAKAKSPYFATYYTFAPHFDYYDYGDEYRVFADPKEKKKALYLNNLVLIDTLLDKLFRQLEDSGTLQDTLIVVVGDHGEAFGQHKGNWGHSRSSREENFRVPLLLLHPSLQPTRVTTPTTHVDIAPTLLDLLGVDVKAATMQGRSLLRPLPARRLFAWGNEGHLTSWTGPQAQKKTQISIIDNSCRVWDLAADPHEQVKGTRCTDADHDDVEALVAWRNHALTILKPYSAALP